MNSETASQQKQAMILEFKIFHIVSGGFRGGKQADNHSHHHTDGPGPKCAIEIFRHDFCVGRKRDEGKVKMVVIYQREHCDRGDLP